MKEKTQLASIALPRKHHGIVTRVLERWRESGVIDNDTAARLADSITVASFDWQRTARYAFIIAIFCLVIALSAVLADKRLMALLARIFSAPAIAKCGFFAIVSAAIFYCGLFLLRISANVTDRFGRS